MSQAGHVARRRLSRLTTRRAVRSGAATSYDRLGTLAVLSASTGRHRRALHDDPVVSCLWSGYLDQMAAQRLTALFAEADVPLLYHHTSGQAHVEDWTRLVSTGSVRLESSPMHSEATSRFVDHFRRVEAHADSEWREV